MHIGIVGFGYWGHIIFQSLIRDRRVTRVSIATQQQLPAAQLEQNSSLGTIRCDQVTFDALLKLKADGIIIATPEETHADLVAQCIQAGVDCFVEKPLALHRNEATQLFAAAQERQVRIQVDQVFLFDQHLRQFLDFMADFHPTQIDTIISCRSAKMDRPKTVSVVTDVFPHDLYILREAFGLHLTAIKVNRSEIGSSQQIAATVQLSAQLQPVSKNTGFAYEKIVEYETYLSWQGDTKKRIVIVGSKKNDIWFRWSIEKNGSKLEQWSQAQLMHQQHLPQSLYSPVTVMMQTWLTQLEQPRSALSNQQQAHWLGVLEDVTWLEKTELLLR